MPISCGLAGWSLRILRVNSIPMWAHWVNFFFETPASKLSVIQWLRGKTEQFIGSSQKVMLGFCGRIWGSWLSESSLPSLIFGEEHIPKKESITLETGIGAIVINLKGVL